jgi:hypothetical protein
LLVLFEANLCNLSKNACEELDRAARAASERRVVRTVDAAGAMALYRKSTLIQEIDRSGAGGVSAGLTVCRETVW